jgi:DNA topoisomerase-1
VIASSSDDDDDVPLAARVKPASVSAPAEPVAPMATAMAPKPAPAPLARPAQPRPPIVVAKPPIASGFKMAKRPVILPAKQSSVLDSSSDEEDDRPIAARKPKGLVTMKPPTSSSAAHGHRDKLLVKKSHKRDRDEKKMKKEKKHHVSGEKRPRESSGVSAPRKTPKSDITWVAKKGAVVQWKTLEHNGVVFPPEYEPHGVPLVYDGQEVVLLPHEEEVAGFFAVMKDSDYAEKPVFVKNFMDGFRATLKNGPHSFITDFKKCDFTKMYMHFFEIREKKKEMTSEEKKKIKADRDAAEEKYTWATIDGRREKVGNFRIEPPGLFRGRGEHPKMGKIKRRIMPEDVTINIGREAKVPEPPAGRSWKAVIHNDTATWLAGWNDVINTKDWKYVQFGATSTIKAESDQKKYEKARSLHKFVDKIRSDYNKNMLSQSNEMAQLAVATYLVDKLALRAGGEKDEDLADTVGVCTLRAGHIEFMENSVIKFDFLGKDSIQYLQEHEIAPNAYSCLKRFCAGKGPEMDIFDAVTPQTVNAHLQTLMPGLTIKVFRTYNASITLDRLLENTNTNDTVLQKKSTYDAANKEVAILCNHQKGVSKAHDTQMEKLQDKKKELAKAITAMKKSDDKNKKKKLAALKERMTKLEIQMNMKEELKTVSLGTSKINYLDPRITLSWCKRHEVPPNTVFTKALIEKFHWAMDCEMDFKFC